MIPPVRPRNCSTEKSGLATVKGSKRICIPIDRAAYNQVIDNKAAFRQLLDEYIEQYPEIFPAKIGQGYKLHGSLAQSKKMPQVRLRRIQLKAADEGQGQVRSYPFSWDGKKAQMRYHAPRRKICKGEDNAIDRVHCLCHFESEPVAANFSDG